MQIAILLLAALLIGVASFLAQGAVPGDVALTAFLQGAAGENIRWSLWLTDTAKTPMLFVTMILAAALAFACGGVRAALSVPLAFALSWASDKLLRMLIVVPRPDADLVTVAAPSASSGLPSTFGLVYGALFGAALMARGAAPLQRAVRVLVFLVLLAGFAARIIPGGHWPSQMLSSLLFGTGLAGASLWLCSKVPHAARQRG